MQRLSDIIENTKTSTENFRKMEVVEIEDVPWKTAKIEVERLPADFGLMMRNHKEYASKKESGNYVRMQANLPSIKGFPCQLIVYEPIKDGDLKAFYVLFNKDKNKVYKRDLM